MWENKEKKLSTRNTIQINVITEKTKKSFKTRLITSIGIAEDLENIFGPRAGAKVEVKDEAEAEAPETVEVAEEVSEEENN